MSQYIPWPAVARELEAQATRKRYGLKSGFYVRYPADEQAQDYFVVKASDMNDELVAKMDQRLALIKLAREGREKSGTNS